MDQALKQRLIGAAVLVALAVIFVPMLLEAPEPEATPAGQLPLDIPPRPDLPMQTRDVPLSLPAPGNAPGSAPATGSAPAVSADDPNRVVTVEADAAPRVDALADSGPAPAATVPTPAPVTAPPAAATPAATTPPPAKPVAATPTPASTPATPAPGASANGRFVVNLGSFANAANAKALNGRLGAQGIPVISESISVDGKPVQRLRAGPYRTRAEAEAAALQIGKLERGAKFTVGELDAPAPVAAAPRVAGGFAVQVGALKSEAEANTLRERLRGAGFAAYVERAQTDAGVLWRVRAGPELQRPRAEALRDQIKQRLQLDGLVVSHP